MFLLLIKNKAENCGVKSCQTAKPASIDYFCLCLKKASLCFISQKISFFLSCWLLKKPTMKDLMGDAFWSYWEVGKQKLGFLCSMVYCSPKKWPQRPVRQHHWSTSVSENRASRSVRRLGENRFICSFWKVFQGQSSAEAQRLWFAAWCFQVQQLKGRCPELLK